MASSFLVALSRRCGLINPISIHTSLSFFSELHFPELALAIDLSKVSICIILFGMVALAEINLQVRVITLVSHPNFDMAYKHTYQTNIITFFFYNNRRKDIIKPPKPTKQQRGQTPQSGSSSFKIILQQQQERALQQDTVTV